MENEETKKEQAPEIKSEFTIIVNARKKIFHNAKISFDEVVVLAFGSVSTNPNIVYGVTYKNGPRENPEGTMDKGATVKIKNGMIFNVTQTDKS